MHCQGYVGQHGEEDAPCIFSEVVPFHILPAGRDEFTALLTVRLKPDSLSHPRSLLVELTDEADLLFYHSLVLGEADFHTLKAEQRLLVDFQCFPGQLAELLRRCIEVSPALGAGGAAPESLAPGALRMVACLKCGTGLESMLSIVEANQFRELTHLALRLRPGTDEVVKQHLAGKLRACRSERTELAQGLKEREEALERTRQQAEELGAKAHAIAEEKKQLENALEAKHQRELAGLRHEQAQALSELQRSLSEERVRVETELKRSLEEATGRAHRAERSGEELQLQRQALMSSGKSCQERLESAEAQLGEARQDVLLLREQVKQLELLKFQQERELGELKIQLSGLREQLALKEQLVTNQMAQLEQNGTQRKGLEEMLAAARQQAHSMEEKFALSAQEIQKGNQIIQSLHSSSKQAKAKLRLKASALLQQEKAVLELEKAEELSKHLLEEKEAELGRAREREERLKEELKELKEKLGEARDVLKSDQDVIQYLNKQLTEKDLKTLPPLPSGPKEPPPLPNPVSPLESLLRRAESAGRALSGGSKPSAETLDSLGLGGITSDLRELAATPSPTRPLSGLGASPERAFSPGSQGMLKALAGGLGSPGAGAAAFSPASLQGAAVTYRRPEGLRPQEPLVAR